MQHGVRPVLHAALRAEQHGVRHRPDHASPAFNVANLLMYVRRAVFPPYTVRTQVGLKDVTRELDRIVCAQGSDWVAKVRLEVLHALDNPVSGMAAAVVEPL